MGMMSKEKLAQILRELREGLAQILEDRLAAIYLYGSQARGDARPDSNIDVLIVLDGDFDYGDVLNRTLDLTAALSLEYDVVISRAFVSRERFEHEMSPFLMNARQTSRTYLGENNRSIRFLSTAAQASPNIAFTKFLL